MNLAVNPVAGRYPCSPPAAASRRRAI